MSETPIYLDPDLFMALGLSAEAHGGIGRDLAWGFADAPLCVRGHAAWLGGCAALMGPTEPAGEVEARLFDTAPGGCYPGYYWGERNDQPLRDAGVGLYDRIPFAGWCRIVNVDVRG